MQMVTNLGQKAKAKWAEAVSAKDPAVKLRCLKEFYSSMRKHKGTERLEMSVKRQISSLEDYIERAKSRRAGSPRLEWTVKKGEAPQLAVIGSLQTATSLFKLMTGLEVGTYDLLIRPVVGVFEGGSTRFQIVLTPFDKSIGEEKQERLISLARSSDAVIIAFGYEATSYVHDVIEWFEDHNIDVRSNRLNVELTYTSSGGLRIVGRSNGFGERAIVDFLSSYGIKNAIVKVSKDTTLDDVERAVFGRTAKAAIFVALNKSLAEESPNLVSTPVFTMEGLNPDSLALNILKRLSLIRIYTKAVGEEPVGNPLLVRNCSKMIEVAEQVHKDLAKFFRYGRVWRKPSVEGVKVGRNFELQDGDIVEIHAG